MANFDLTADVDDARCARDGAISMAISGVPDDIVNNRFKHLLIV
jgi:hypothetical protein